MRSTMNVGFILRLFCVIVVLTVAVDGNNTSPGSTPSPVKKGDNTVIVNVNQDSREIKEAIKSLETTLERKFQQLMRAINGTSHGILKIVNFFALFYSLPSRLTFLHFILGRFVL